MEAVEVHLHNYRLALDQAQNLLVLAFGSGVGVLLLRLASPATKVTVPGTFVEVDLETARLLVLGFHIVVAALATYIVETCRRLAYFIESRPEIAKAMYDYPSMPCSPWLGVRVSVPVFSLGFVAWAQFSGSAGFGLGDSVVIVLLLSVHGTLISYLWRHPNGEVIPRRLLKSKIEN